MRGASVAAPTTRTRVRRHPERGAYDRATIAAIVDDAYVGHLGFVVDDQPWVIPVAIVRDGGTVYVHGSAASRAMRTSASGTPVCLTVTHLDGLVLAASAFSHSMNYRSVVIVGTARVVTDHDEQVRVSRALTEHLEPGRWERVRHPDEQELRQTTFLALSLDEASAKIRTGPPSAEPDGTSDVPTGVIPVTTRLGVLA